jgi:hypothetical protein
LDPSKGTFQAQAILDIIVNVWFKSANNEGPAYPEEFNLIPKALFALVLTAVSLALFLFVVTCSLVIRCTTASWSF